MSIKDRNALLDSIILLKKLAEKAKNTVEAKVYQDSIKTAKQKLSNEQN